MQDQEINYRLISWSNQNGNTHSLECCTLPVEGLSQRDAGWRSRWSQAVLTVSAIPSAATIFPGRGSHELALRAASILTYILSLNPVNYQQKVGSYPYVLLVRSPYYLIFESYIPSVLLSLSWKNVSIVMGIIIRCFYPICSITVRSNHIPLHIYIYIYIISLYYTILYIYHISYIYIYIYTHCMTYIKIYNTYVCGHIMIASDRWSLRAPGKSTPPPDPPQQAALAARWA